MNVDLGALPELKEEITVLYVKRYKDSCFPALLIFLCVSQF